MSRRLDVCLETDKLVFILDSEKKELLTQKELSEIKIKNLDLNVAEYKKETAEFKDAYTKKNDELNKLQSHVPSRVTWFAIGSGVTATLSLIMALLLSR